MPVGGVVSGQRRRPASASASMRLRVSGRVSCEVRERRSASVGDQDDRHADRDDDRPSRACPGSSAASRAAGSSRPFLEGVPDAVHGADEARVVAVLAELAADPGDVRVDDAATRVVAVAPDPSISWSRERTTPGSRASASRISNSSGVRPISSPSTADPAPAAGRSRARCARSGPCPALGLHPLHPPQDRLHPGGELPQAERLREVVVGADREPGDLVGLLGPAPSASAPGSSRPAGSACRPRARPCPGASGRARRGRGDARRAARSPAGPSSATTTWYPSLSSRARTASAIASSSSTTSTVCSLTAGIVAARMCARPAPGDVEKSWRDGP